MYHFRNQRSAATKLKWFVKMPLVFEFWIQIALTRLVRRPFASSFVAADEAEIETSC